MEDQKPTMKQVVLFTVVLSFIVSVIGTVLTAGLLESVVSISSEEPAPFVFNRPRILERITERVAGDTEEKIIRQDELIVGVVERVSSAVVSVIATKDVPVAEQYYIDPFGGDPFFRQFFGEEFRVPQYRQRGTEQREVSSGSGFFVAADGYIVTNKHVVADTEATYTVFLNDGKKYPAKVLARDPLQDLAVLKVEGKGFTFLPMGDSSRVKIGQTAIAIGNALGEFRNTVSVGVISGLQRTIVASSGAGSAGETLQELIQTDAAINPGNSGGPVLNLQGEVIGISTAIARGAENIGFAIPINKAKRDVENVRQHGRIIYPFLGVRYAIITKELAESRKLGRDYGVLVTGSQGEPAVLPGSPAEKAGLKEADIILAFNGERIDTGTTLANYVQKYNVGDEITLRVLRNGQEMDVKIKLEERK